MVEVAVCQLRQTLARLCDAGVDLDVEHALTLARRLRTQAQSSSKCSVILHLANSMHMQNGLSFD